jgi:signal transduction histidine kinase
MRGWRQRLAAGLSHMLRWARSSRWDIVWAAFVALNLVVMRLEPAWGTVPFLAIWVSLTVIYGYRLWRLQPAILTFAVVTIATGAIIGIQVIDGQQDADYLAEVPLVALMFLIMVWHGRRRQAAVEERLAAMEQLQRVSQENLRLLEQQRLFLLDASHELGTPITVALGHAELIEQAVTDEVVAEDARVVVGELGRLRRLAGRLLLLTSADTPGFLHVAPVAVDTVVMEALDRWGYVPRRWRLGEVSEGVVLGDGDRLAVAMDALLENAIAHTEADDLIELSARIQNGYAVLAVTDSGCGIPEQDLERIFSRFSRATPFRSREAGGFGLGLPVVAAIAEAHHGSVRVTSSVGRGSTFELLVPTAGAAADQAQSPSRLSTRRLEPRRLAGASAGPWPDPPRRPGAGLPIARLTRSRWLATLAFHDPVNSACATHAESSRSWKCAAAGPGLYAQTVLRFW